MSLAWKFITNVSLIFTFSHAKNKFLQNFLTRFNNLTWTYPIFHHIIWIIMSLLFSQFQLFLHPRLSLFKTCSHMHRLSISSLKLLFLFIFNCIWIYIFILLHQFGITKPNIFQRMTNVYFIHFHLLTRNFKQRLFVLWCHMIVNWIAITL